MPDALQDVPEPFDLVALAEAVGASVATVGRLVELGIVLPGVVAPGAFRPSDIVRVRLTTALEASGVSAEAIGGAIASGGLSFDFLDELTPEPTPLLGRSQAEVLRELGIGEGLSQRLHAVIEAAGGTEDEPIRRDDAAIDGLISRTLALGIGEDQLVRIDSPRSTGRVPASGSMAPGV